MIHEGQDLSQSAALPVEEPFNPAVFFGPLENHLKKRFDQWVQDRKNQELKFQRAYNDYMRITQGSSAKGTGLPASPSNEGIFVGLTRGKVRTARSKIKDILFGNGQDMPFDVQPVDPRFNEFAVIFKQILVQQLDDGDFIPSIKSSISQDTTYGTSYVAGPFVRTRTLRKPSIDAAGMLGETEFSYPEPYFESPLTMDVYPDSSAADETLGEGLFWEMMYAPDDVRSWKGDERYFNIDEALKKKEVNYTGRGSDLNKASRAGTNLSLDGRIPVARFFGVVERGFLPKEYLEKFPKLADVTHVNITAYIAGGVIVRVDISPYWSFTRKRPIYRCIYEASDGEFFGVGVPENNSPQQALMNAAFRIFVRSKAIALNPPFLIDKSKFKNSENFKLEQGKALNFKEGLSAQDKKDAFQLLVIPDVSEGWQTLFALSHQIGDEDTAVPRATQGMAAPDQSRTATGMSMLMGAAHIPMKEVITNIDSMLIEPIINALIEWNFKYLEPEVVAELHGPQAAQMWGKIKQSGSTSFMKWNATGTNTFMAKEVLVTKFQGFLNIVASSPALAQYVNLHDLLVQIWDAMGTGKTSPVLSSEQVRQLVAEQLAQQQGGMPSGMEQGGQPGGTPPGEGTMVGANPEGTFAQDYLATGEGSDARIAGAAQ